MLPKSFNEKLKEVSNKIFKKLFIVLIVEVVLASIVIVLLGDEKTPGYTFFIIMTFIMLMAILVYKREVNKFSKKAKKMIKNPDEEFEFIHNLVGISENHLAIFNKDIIELKEIAKISPATDSTLHLPVFCRSYNVNLLILFKNGDSKSIGIYQGQTFLKGTIDRKHYELIEIVMKLGERGLEIA